jgi:hypothetical protein
MLGCHVEQDIAVGQEHGPVAGKSRVSAMISSVVMRMVAVPRSAAKRLALRFAVVTCLVAMIRPPTGS